MRSALGILGILVFTTQKKNYQHTFIHIYRVIFERILLKKKINYKKTKKKIPKIILKKIWKLLLGLHAEGIIDS